MKVLLLRVEESEKHENGIPSPTSIHPPLDLLYIAAALENNDHKVEIIDLTAEDTSKKQIKKYIASSDAVGINVQSKNHKTVADISKIIKQIDPHIPLIIGGPYCTFFQKHSLSVIPSADISVIGEGEHVINDIIQSLQGQIKLSDINGIFYRENNIIKSGKPPQVIEDLDSLPFPSRHLVEKYTYGIAPGLFRVFKKKFTTMITSRGCPFGCRFCSRYNNVIKGYTFRQRSAENVVREIQEIDGKYGSVMIVDDNFLADNKRAHKIFDMLIEKGTNIELIITGARVDSADKELYIKMKKANVKLICFGLESGNQDVLDFYNKKITLQQIRDTIRLAKKTGFLTYGSFILGAPIETKKHFEKTVKFACSLPLDIADFRPLLYQMGSDLWIEAVRNKQISPDEDSVLPDITRGLGNFTAEELEAYIEKAYRRFYLRPSYLTGQIYNALIRKDASLLKDGLKSLTTL